MVVRRSKKRGKAKNPYGLCNWLLKKKRITKAKYDQCVRSLKKSMHKRGRRKKR